MVVLSVILAALVVLLCFQDQISDYLVEKRTVTVYLVRHGQTEANIGAQVVGGGSDSPLTDTGIKESKKLGKYLKDIHFAKAYSSKLGRAISTEKYVLSENEYWKNEKKDIITLSRLNDIDYGEADGISIQDAYSKFGAEFGNFGTASNKDFKPVTNGENMYDFIKRFGNAIDEIVNTRENYGKTVIVTAHSSAGFWMKQTFPGVKNVGITNDSYSIFTYDGKDYKLLKYNQTVN